MLLILLILTAAFALLTWKNLHAGLLLLVAVLPSYLLRVDILGVPTTLLELLVVTFLVVWSVKRVACSELTVRSLFHVSRFTLSLVLLLLAATISVFVAPDFVGAVGVWKAYFLEPILLFFVVRYELTRTDSIDANRSPDRIMSSHLFQALGVSAIILSVIAITQWLTGAGLPIPWDIERRVTSVFDYPNALGLYLGPVVVIAVMSLRAPAKQSSDERLLRRFAPRNDTLLFWLAVTVLSSTAIVLAQSEAAIVSVIATVLIAGFLYRKTRVLSSSLIVLSIVAALLFPPLFQKLTLQDYSGSVRLSQWSETADLLQDHWLLGAGLSGYPTALAPYHQATHLEIFQYPHNIVLNVWVELGLLGLIAFALLAWHVIVSLRGGLWPTKQSLPMSRERLLRSLSLPRNDTNDDRALGMTQTVAFLALMQMSIHGLVDVPYFKNDLAILTWVLLAIVFAYARPSTPTTPS